MDSLRLALTNASGKTDSNGLQFQGHLVQWAACVCVWIGGRGLRPHTKGHLPLQISELKNHSVLQALTAEANGWEPGGKVPFGARRAWVGLKAEHVGLSFPPLNFFP